ncbi:MAG: hypothetical protein CL814_02100 [Confluentimicrobium sp.]|jgi:hypothetical protein|uniref:DUF6477 family protein n=1 Tax=Actibacterium sp. TaxID=1872125 RepID=UPI000C3EF9C7|nr:DUF6477 family protein [Actibacterium sp.]MBC55705.1 hypothetical protein [Actibacterium sp.]|tara:strand:+ start:1121 stop:1414 length:294 start_codon:yes stop_codon:yes gene_type:complete
MSDPLSILKTLRRPRLLIRAARFGLTDYRRERDLSRLMKCVRLPSPLQSLGALLEQEEQMEATRKSGDATYSVARHIEVLIALMAEARLLPRTDARP